MAWTTIKVSTTTRDRLKVLGEELQASADEVVTSALKELERKRFWQAYERAHAAEQADPEAVEQAARERQAWVRASMADLHRSQEAGTRTRSA